MQTVKNAVSYVFRAIGSGANWVANLMGGGGPGEEKTKK